MTPLRVGRFVVLDQVGGGGMGVVYRAYDPSLGRRVALKVLRGAADRSPQAAQARLQREAKALARLSHENVVAIHEVGTFDGETFLAMEYVDGVDLSVWAQANPAGGARLHAARRLLVQAGRGLAAAHRAGLVHRDFKPANVLVGEDGRARVADFGLVQEATPSAVGTSGGSSPPEATTIAGTPRYMSPEQRDGAAVTPASDQYSFCVTAWEVLFGAPPHGTQAPEGAPGWLVDVLRRGLAVEPSERHRSMDALLRRLAVDPRRRRRTRAAAVVVALALGGGVAAYAHGRATACDDGPEALANVWNANTRMGIGSTRAAELDAFAERWRETFAEACDAGRRRAVWSPPQLRAAIGCLALQRVTLDAAVELERTEGIAAGLPAPSTCLRPVYSDPVDDAVERVYRDLQIASNLRAAGREAPSLEHWGRVESSMDAIDNRAVQAMATAFRADTAAAAGEKQAAETLALAGYAAALEHGDNVTAAAFAVRLTALAGANEAAADLWSHHAELLEDPGML